MYFLYFQKEFRLLWVVNPDRLHARYIFWAVCKRFTRAYLQRSTDCERSTQSFLISFGIGGPRHDIQSGPIANNARLFVKSIDIPDITRFFPLSYAIEVCPCYDA